MSFNSFVGYFLEHNRYLNIFGILLILFVAWVFSKKRSKISFRLVLSALSLHFLIAVVVLKVSWGKYILQKVAFGVEKVYACADVGLKFVFGSLADDTMPWGVIFAVKILPVIVFFGALMALLYHFRIIQFFVLAISRLIRPILGTSGAETLCAITNSFLGQTEAPLLVKNYLRDMTKSEFLLVMVSGMATISGAILVVFYKMGVPIKHLLAASAMAIPGSILMAKMLLPETEKPKTSVGSKVTFERDTSNMFDAIFVGTTDGLKLALNVGAMLISFLALLAMMNFLLGAATSWIFGFLGLDWPAITVNSILSYVFSPFAYLLGFVGNEALKAGELLGTKVAVNELFAYIGLIKANLSERTTSIMTYALCGFSNFSCIGIQIGGIGALVPGKRLWLTQLGLYAVLGGALSNLLSAMIASLLL
ncbi:NupC/NupG family nucleoside CNT transporter [Candidatus Dependentiae bacterium]